MNAPSSSVSSSADTEEAVLDVTAEAARLRLALVRLNRQVRQNMESGVTPTQLSVLAVLGRHGPLRPAELADRERIARSTVTRLAATLESAGLVARTADPDDGRACRLELTEGGRGLLEASRRRAAGFLATRLTAIAADPDAVHQVCDLLEALADRQ